MAAATLQLTDDEPFNTSMTTSPCMITDAKLTDKLNRGNGTIVARSITILISAYKKAPAWVQLSLGSITAILLYSIVFLTVFLWISVSNTLAYGPTHTAYTTATLGGMPSTIQTSNVGGTVYVTIINQQKGSSQTYTGPKLDAAAWGSDLSSIVVTAKVHPNQTTITIHLIGNINYFRLFFVRPEMTFQLVSDKLAGYKVIQP